MIVFENKGTLDIRMASMFGVSAKEGTSPIGYFGTGLKYAIAIILRHGGGVDIHTDGDTYQFGIENTTLRNTTFNVITMNENPLGYTTELGKNWELWQAFRELASNTFDEEGIINQYDGFESLQEEDENLEKSLKDIVRIVVYDLPEFDEIYENRSDVYLEDSEFTGRKNLDTLPFNTNFIFYRKIRVFKTDKPCLFTYNLHNTDLTEDRTLKYPFWDKGRIAESVAYENDDQDYIEKVILAPASAFEHDLDFRDVQGYPSELFMSLVKKLQVRTDVNKTAVELYKRWVYRQAFSGMSFGISASENIDVALNGLADIGYEIRDNYEIRYAESGAELVLGEEKRITLNKDLLTEEPRTIALYLLHGHFQAIGTISNPECSFLLVEEIVNRADF